jgi:hypothetical protein
MGIAIIKLGRYSLNPISWIVMVFAGELKAILFNVQMK